ncbi:MAG: hypothetical protein ACJ78Q_12970, partial [Chloroflexia bacterium]
MNIGNTNTNQVVASAVVLLIVVLGGVVLAFTLAGKPPQDGARAAAPLAVPPSALKQSGPGANTVLASNLTPWPNGGTDASRLHDLVYKSRGKVIAQGTNTAPTGPNKLKTYRVEEIDLPKGSVVAIKGENVKTDKVWRVTISGGP